MTNSNYNNETSELKGYATIYGTKRLCNVHENGNVWVKNYIGEFVLIQNPIILEFHYL